MMTTYDNTSIITLLTDFGLHDEYVGVMKGVIYRFCSTVNIVDLCHSVPPQDTLQAALMLEASYRYFDRGTIHVVVVDPGVGTERHILLVRAENQIFIGPDNGVLTLALQSQLLESCHRLTIPKDSSSTFHGRDIMAPAAGRIACGADPNELGIEVDIENCVLLTLPQATSKADHIIGEVVAIDHFGNLLTSITGKQVEELGKDVQVAIGTTTITAVSSAYGNVSDYDLVALINSRGRLEIAVNQGNAARTVNATIGQKVIVKKEFSFGPASKGKKDLRR